MKIRFARIDSLIVAPPRFNKRGIAMKYLLMMNFPKGNGNYQIDDWVEKDLQTHLQFLADFNKRLKESGEFAGVQGLTSPGQAKLVRANPDATPNTDGV